MIVIFGTRLYGEVDRHAGQRQMTRFFHIYYVPLLPIETRWLTQGLADGWGGGHPTRMTARSVVAGYARVWGPIAAFAALSSWSIGGLAAAGALAALSAWTWTWRSLRRGREQLRSDHHFFAFGTRCDPLVMDAGLAATLQPIVAERWADVAGGRTPEDVARLGADNPTQAALAYASLRLAARLAPGEAARKARAAAERVLDAIKDPSAALEGGPYRATAPAQLPAPSAATDGAGR